MLKLSTAFCFVVVIILMSSNAIRAAEAEYDIILKNGMIYDGSGSEPYKGDIAINGDKIAAVGKIENAKGKQELDVKGMAVAPGFINMLSWAPDSLIQDGTSLSDIRQGVTLEVFGEGWSYGPLTEAMKKEQEEQQGDIKYKIEWNTLGQFLEFLEKKGVSPNVASFVGATTVRINVVGYEDRPPNPEELDKMRALVKESMEEGAMGVGSSLIYAPSFYAKTDELVELCKVAGQYGGMYISHMRSEANKLLEAVDELITISREAKLPAEIYHLKAAGVQNWKKMDEVISKVEAAQKEGLKITADMYMYPAGGTGLNATMPPWVQEGGFEKWRERLMDPKIRERVIKEMSTPSDDWENMFLLVGSADKILLADFKSEKLKPLTGKTLADVAKMRGKSPQETAMDLVIEDESPIGAIYFLMSEDNIKKEVALPWVSFGSDEGSYRPEGIFLKSNAHPRAYGNFARVIGKYVREEKALTLQDAVRRLSSLPAQNLKIKDRGALKPGYFADVVVFDPKTVADHATFDKPHQLATGVIDVFVNGTQVLKNQEHTGATPGRFVRGPGWKQSPAP
jgi:N-acyl-D-aspartate/D-glutamate deacylase